MARNLKVQEPGQAPAEQGQAEAVEQQAEIIQQLEVQSEVVEQSNPKTIKAPVLTEDGWLCPEV